MRGSEGVGRSLLALSHLRTCRRVLREVWETKHQIQAGRHHAIGLGADFFTHGGRMV